MTEDKQGPVDELELAQRLVAQAKAEGVSLTGPGGLLGELTKRVLETALEGTWATPRAIRPAWAAATRGTGSGPRRW